MPFSLVPCAKGVGMSACVVTSVGGCTSVCVGTSAGVGMSACPTGQMSDWQSPSVLRWDDIKLPLTQPPAGDHKTSAFANFRNSQLPGKIQ